MRDYCQRSVTLIRGDLETRANGTKVITFLFSSLRNKHL